MNEPDFSLSPAGLLRRYSAYTLDMLLISAAAFGLARILYPPQNLCPTLSPDCLGVAAEHMILAALVWTAIYLLLSLFYYPLLEASPWQGTVGKILIGLYVTDEQGRRVGEVRTLARHLSSVVNWVTLGIAPVAIVMREDGRGVHDLLSGTYVQQTPLTIPKRIWIAIALLAHLMLCAYLALELAEMVMMQLPSEPVQPFAPDPQ